MVVSPHVHGLRHCFQISDGNGVVQRDLETGLASSCGRNHSDDDDSAAPRERYLNAVVASQRQCF